MKIRDDFKRNVTSGKYKINMNGHHGYSRDDFELSVFDDKWTIKYFLDKIMNGLRSDVDWIGIEYDGDPFNPTPQNPVTLCGFDTCGECGKDVNWIFDGQTISVINKNKQDNFICPESGGIQSWKVFLNIPSGKIVFGNDFRGLVPEGNANRYVNYECEIRSTTYDYIDQQMFHSFVGNTCPSVFVDNNDITVGNFYDDEPLEQEPISGTNIGSVCTDLWWVSAMDQDLYIKLSDDKGVSSENRERNVDCTAEVDPGMYEITCYRKTEDTNVFVKFKKVS